MQTIFDWRGANFRRLLEAKFDGSNAKAARALGRPNAYVWQLINKQRNIGERVARHIEQVLGLAPCELDRDPQLAFAEVVAFVVPQGDRPSLGFVMLPVLMPDQVLPYLESLKAAAGRKRKGVEVDNNNFLTVERLPAPSDVGAQSFYYAMPDDTIKEIALQGERLLIDVTITEPHDRWFQLVYISGWNFPMVRQCEVKADGRFIWTLPNNFRSPLGPVRPGELGGVRILGTVVSVLRDVAPGPRRSERQERQA